jgi:hypothetical protein
VQSQVSPQLVKDTKKRTFAPVTSVSLRRDGLRVMAVGCNNRRAVKEKAKRQSPGTRPDRAGP